MRICDIGHHTIMANLRSGIIELELFGQIWLR